MRLKTLLMVGVVVATFPLQTSARVLVPDEDKTPTSSNDLPSPNLGLVPRQTTPAQQQPAPTPPRPAPQQPQATTPAPAQIPAPVVAPKSTDIKLDTVNTDIVQSIDINLLRKSMPSEFKDLSDSDIKKMITAQFGSDRSDLTKKYMKTDPKTGETTIDFEQLQKDSAVTQSKLTFNPGGKVASSKTWSVKDKMTASLLSQGDDSAIDSESMTGHRKLKFMDKPPTIVPNKGLAKYDSPTLKKEIAVSLPKDYVWGTSDSQKVETQLGYANDAIPANCQLRMDVSLQSDDGQSLYNATIMSGTAEKIGYNGTIRSISARPYAVCNRPSSPLPNSGSILFSYFDKYAVMLQQADCAPTATSTSSGDRGPSSVIVQYPGDSKITCTFIK